MLPILLAIFKDLPAGEVVQAVMPAEEAQCCRAQASLLAEYSALNGKEYIIT